MSNKLVYILKGKVTQGIFFVLINTFLWGISPWVIRQGLKTVTPIGFLFYRFFWVTVLALLLYKGALKNIAIILKNKKLLFSAIAFNFLTLLFYFYGLSMLTAVQAGILAGTSPLFVIIPLLISKQESMDIYEIFGVLLILLGYLTVLFPSLEHSTINYLGVLLLLLGNLIFAVSVIINKKELREQFRKAYEIVSYFGALIGFAIINLFLLFTHRSIALFSLSGLFSWPVLYMAIASSFIAVAFFNKAMIYLEASEVISFSYVQPLFLLLWEVFILQTVSLNKYNLMGILLLFFGTIINIIGIYKEHYVNLKKSNNTK